MKTDSIPRLLALLIVLVWSVAVEAAAPRWNVLFVFADDWGRYAGAYAGLDGRPGLSDVVRTPNVDRVAREGVVFRRAFVNAPSCTPCRSSLLSGRWFFNTGRGAILQGAVWDTTIPSFPLMLRDTGYHIGKSFKVWSPGTPADAPFGGQKHAYQKAGNAANNWSEEMTRMMESGLSLEEARGRILGQVRANFSDFLSAAKASEPWLYWFGITTTHRTWVKGSGRKFWRIDSEQLRGRMPGSLPDVPEIREDVADYLGECQAVDACLGTLLERVKETGQLDQTLIVISGDHGMPGVPGGKCNLYDLGTAVPLIMRVPGGVPGRIVDDFVSLPDLAPTLMEVGGVEPPRGLYGKSLLGILRSSRSGQIESNRTWVISGRERHVESARPGHLPYPSRALRTAEFLYIRNYAPDRWPMGSPYDAATEEPDWGRIDRETRAAYPDMDASPTRTWLIRNAMDPKFKAFADRAFARRPAEELYDLAKDPDQIRNVAGEPAYQATQLRLSEQLRRTLVEAGDPRVTGDGTKFDQPPFAGVEPGR